MLSVALVLTLRWTGVTRYAALWCPDFPLHPELDSGLLKDFTSPKKALKLVQHAAIRRPARCKYTAIVDKNIPKLSLMANQNQSLFYLCKDACLGFGIWGSGFDVRFAVAVDRA